MGVHASVSFRFLLVVIFVLALETPQCAQAYAGPDTAPPDLVIVGHVVDVKTVRIPPGSISPDELRWTTFTVRLVLQGDPEIAGQKITTQYFRRTSGPQPMPFFLHEGRDYVVSLRRQGSVYTPVARLAYEITSRTVQLPVEAPLQEKINLLLLATLRDCRDNAMICGLVFDGLRWERASLDSPYYDLLSEYRRFDSHPQAALQAQAAYARLLLGDETALSRAMRVADKEKWLAPRLPDALQKFGDDAVTTLCLLAEGKCAKGGEANALRVLREMKSPYALPTLIRCLDNPDAGVRYMAYSAIESTTGRYGTKVDDFIGTDHLTPEQREKYTGGHLQLEFNPPTTHSIMLVEKMKQWWEGEGEKQFDYTLPKEK